MESKYNSKAAGINSKVIVTPEYNRKSNPAGHYDASSSSSTSKAQQNMSLLSSTRPLPSGAHFRSRASNFSVERGS